MKEDHMMMLATRLYNDDAYDGYEIIYLVLPLRRFGWLE